MNPSTIWFRRGVYVYAFLRGDAAYRRYVDSIFQVSVSANRHLYDRMMKEDKENVRSLKGPSQRGFCSRRGKRRSSGRNKRNDQTLSWGDGSGSSGNHHQDYRALFPWWRDCKEICWEYTGATTGMTMAMNVSLKGTYSMINITFDFRFDSKGKDPDTYM